MSATRRTTQEGERSETAGDLGTPSKPSDEPATTPAPSSTSRRTSHGSDRFEVRPWRVLGDDGWGVFDTRNNYFVGGWFAAHIRSAAEAMVPYYERGNEPAFHSTPEDEA